jgi:ADP-L-glycero-D-manno-heptose 6-epimerase
MKILITGYKGFIGQNVVNALKDTHDLVMFEWGDKYPDLKGIDWVMHFGAISATTERNVEKIMRQNYDFSVLLHQYCARENINFQYSSSASVYGLNNSFAETDPVDPRTPYAWSKYMFDKYVTDHPTNNIVQGFRYFNVYGPHEEHKGNQASPHHQFKTQAINSGVIKLFKSSENYFRDFVPVETVINTHIKFLDIKESGIWNVGTGSVKSFQEVAEEIAFLYNVGIEYIDMPDDLKSSYQEYTKADLTKLNRTLGL